MAKESSTVEKQIGEAWSNLRSGQYDLALKGFNDALIAVPNSVDAYYGMGLTYRAQKNKTSAIESFQSAFNIAKELLVTIRSQVGSDENANNLNTTEDDRMMMMARMSKQRLSELGVSTE